MADINREVAAWMAKVAEALEKVGDLKSSHGLYYISRATVGFDDEPDGTSYQVTPDEYGGYAVGVKP